MPSPGVTPRRSSTGSRPSSSYKGSLTRLPSAYAEQHGYAHWTDIAAGLRARPSCPKLRCHWEFDGCGYRKATNSCGEPDHLPRCPLPSHPLRKGSLNQAAYSLFLFVRDVCHSDLVGWIDERLAGADEPGAPDRATRRSSSRCPISMASRERSCRWPLPTCSSGAIRTGSVGLRPARR